LGALLWGSLLFPPGLEPLDARGPLLGAVAAGALCLIEWKLRSVELRVLFASLIGIGLGVAVAGILATAIPLEILPGVPPWASRAALFLGCGYLGFALGALRGGGFTVEAMRSLLRGQEPRRFYKVLDTSVVIDSRIADVCETGFLDGVLVVPQFVLRELQHIADSSDPLRRNRGRKGLETLQRMQKNANVRVQISEVDYPEVPEVDQKLIELALRLGGKIVTNDFNLNQVAQLRGVDVLNINDLANSLKPVVLPGEPMKVFILKEGKEPNQGVGYLDDGTMVVVDNAKRFLGKDVEIVITSVLQTTAGKMFFGKFESDLEKPRKAG
ncbi:MAG: TRAM domain-containing protein, partial [Acidobacteria bacterium]|nr:TRAM domain-containing protein [Acidobacteriota bacterium]